VPPIFTTIVLLIAVAYPLAGSTETSPTLQLYRVFWPHISLASGSGERISSIKVSITCGRFRGIGNIPDDWSLNVVSPMSEQTTLSASAGHGSSELWNLNEVDGQIQISIDTPECFDISAQVTAETSESSRKLKFTRAQLRLSK